jgi:hypothetical protein
LHRCFPSLFNVFVSLMSLQLDIQF